MMAIRTPSWFLPAIELTARFIILFQFHAVWRHSEGDSMDPIGESSGLKMECNTRR